MIFKKIAMEIEQFGEENFADLQNILKDECQIDNAPLLDIINMKKNNDDINEISYKESLEGNSFSESVGAGSFKSKRSKKIRRHRTKIIRDTITAIWYYVII